MRRSRPSLILLALSLCAIASLSSRAAVTYRWITDQPAYSVPVNSTVPVAVFLEETITTPDTSILLADGGLFTAGFRFVENPPLPADPADFLLSNVVVSPELEGPFQPEQQPLSVRVSDFTAFPGPVGSEISPGVRRVLIATVNFTGGSVLGETTTFHITDYATGASDDTVTWRLPTLRVLDSLIADSPSFSINTVPEPSAVALLALSLSTLLTRRGRSRIHP